MPPTSPSKLTRKDADILERTYRICTTAQLDLNLKLYDVQGHKLEKIFIIFYKKQNLKDKAKTLNNKKVIHIREIYHVVQKYSMFMFFKVNQKKNRKGDRFIHNCVTAP